MKALARIIARLTRRHTPPAHRGWQDFEVGAYIAEPAPVERVKFIDIMPNLDRWQEALLRAHGWDVRDQMLRAHRRPEDARITVHNAKPGRPGLTVFGIPVRLDPCVPRGEVWIESGPKRFREPALAHFTIHKGGSVTRNLPLNGSWEIQ